jgi:hypothetical protein
VTDQGHFASGGLTSKMQDRRPVSFSKRHPQIKTRKIWILHSKYAYGLNGTNALTKLAIAICQSSLFSDENFFGGSHGQMLTPVIRYVRSKHIGGYGHGWGAYGKRPNSQDRSALERYVFDKIELTNKFPKQNIRESKNCLFAIESFAKEKLVPEKVKCRIAHCQCSRYKTGSLNSTSDAY